MPDDSSLPKSHGDLDLGATGNGASSPVVDLNQLVPVVDLNQLVPDRQTRARRPFRRLPAVILITVFAGIQGLHWVDAVAYSGRYSPSPVLGPLYFFVVDGTVADIWMGAVLSAFAVPLLLAYPLRPSRLTAGICLMTIIVWVTPGIIAILRRY